MSGRSALKGFSSQFIYSIHRILENSTEPLLYTPEGVEDLDIHHQDSGTFEFVQVKDLADNLSLSHFGPLTDNRSFFKRILPYLKTNPDSKATIVSLGPIGEEFSHAFKPLKNSKLWDKLTAAGFPEEDTSLLQSRIHLEEANIQELEQSIFNEIQIILPGIQGKGALRFLQSWICECSIHKKSVTKKELIAQLHQIERLIKRRASLLDHFHKTILPIQHQDQDEVPNWNVEVLKKEYAEGISTRIEHIQMNLDVPRPDIIEQVNSDLEKSKVVILSGPSGQGKTSIAFRYLLHHSHFISYHVIPATTSKESHEQIATMQELAKTSNIPTLFYLDIEPHSENWVSVVESVQFHSNVYCLITIRSEDFNSVLDNLNFNYSNINLQLHEQEARNLFKAKTAFSANPYYNTFEEAWDSFQNNGPLMEFIHLLNHGETLARKIRRQVLSLQKNNEEPLIHLLELVAVADSLGGAIDRSKLAGYPQIQSSLALLENEFLIRINDRKSIGGVHPIRSKAIREVLFLDEHDRLNNLIVASIKFLDEAHVYRYLLSAFNTHSEPDNILLSLQGHAFSTWQGNVQCLQALIWFGIQSLFNDYSHTFQKLNAIDSSGTLWFSYFDIQGFDLKKESANLHDNLHIVLDRINSIIKEDNLSPTVYHRPVENWLRSISLTVLSPLAEQDLIYFSEVQYWQNRFGIQPFPPPDLATLKHAICHSHPSLGAHGMYGASFIYTPEEIQQLESSYKDIMKKHFSLLLIEEGENYKHFHFFIDVLSEVKPDQNLSIHNLKMEIIDCARLAFPHLEYYRASGYGSELIQAFFQYDESLANIPRKNLPLPFLTAYNGLLLNLNKFDSRPETWIDFVTREQSLQRAYRIRINKYNSHLVKAQQNPSNRSDNFYQYCKYYIDCPSIENEQLLPKSISDPFGHRTEGSDKRHRDAASKNVTLGYFNRILSAIDYRSYDHLLENRRKYFFHLDNFIRQSAEAIATFIDSTKTIRENHIRVSRSNILDAIQYQEKYYSELTKIFPRVFSASNHQALFKEDRKHLVGLYLQYEIALGNLSKKHAQLLRNPLKFMTDSVTELEDKLLDSLDELISRNLAKDISFVDHESCLYVILDLKSPEIVYDTCMEAYSLLHNTIAPLDTFSVPLSAFLNHYGGIKLVPTFRQKSIFGDALDLYPLALHQESAEQRAEKLLLFSPLSTDELSTLEIQTELETDPFLKQVNEFKKHVGILYQTVGVYNHICNIPTLFDNEIEDGSTLQHVLKNTQTTIHVSLEWLLEFYSEVLSPIINKEEQSLEESQLSSIVMLFFKLILPPNFLDRYNGQINISAKDFKVWNSQLQESGIPFFQTQILLLAVHYNSFQGQG